MVHDVRRSSPKPWITVAVVGVLLLVVFAFVREYVRNIDIATELERMQAENAALSAERLASLELISQLSTKTAVEREARTKLNLAAPGETLYVVQSAEPSVDGDMVAARDISSLAQDSSVSNPLKWLWYFFAPDSFRDQGGV